MSYYVQDSSLAYWQLAVSILGQPELISVGAQIIVPLVVQDSSLAYWQVGATTSGQPKLDAVGATTTTAITIQDSNGVVWSWGAGTAGQTLVFPILVLSEDSYFNLPITKNAQTVVTVF